MATLSQLRAALSNYPVVEARIRAALTNNTLLSARLGQTRAELHAESITIRLSNRVLSIALVEVAWLLFKVP